MLSRRDTLALIGLKFGALSHWNICDISSIEMSSGYRSSGWREVEGCRRIGAQEIHFDPTFMRGVQESSLWLKLMEQLRKLV